uniref:Uncharacterized protein n=1 Tax=Plectus sambesii TaxID=2011161 RepID=A0A914XM22_9BILA
MSRVPGAFATVQDRIIAPGKQLFADNKESLSKFVSKKTSTVDRQQLINEDENPSGRLDVDSSDLYSYEGTTSSIAVHRNKVLNQFDKCACCRCAKRWQLAILANIGFIVVFGIRCNFGAAKNHMARNYTDPYGVKHEREFHWTRNELGVMESSFFYGYLITQIPGGFFAAKFAPNKLFGLAIGAASFFNLFLPMAFNSHSDMFVVVIQVAQGLAQ